MKHKRILGLSTKISNNNKIRISICQMRERVGSESKAKAKHFGSHICDESIVLRCAWNYTWKVMRVIFRNTFTKQSDKVNIIWNDIYSRTSPSISSTLYACLSSSASCLLHFLRVHQLKIGFTTIFAITRSECEMCLKAILSRVPPENEKFKRKPLVAHRVREQEIYREREIKK